MWGRIRKLIGRLLDKIRAASAMVCFSALASPAWAQTSGGSSGGMPWEAPLQKILTSLQGPVVKAVAVIIIIVTGLSLAFGDGGGGFRKLIQIVFGLAIAAAATSFASTLFGIG